MRFRRGLTVAAAVAVLAPLGASGAAAVAVPAPLGASGAAATRSAYAFTSVRAATAKYHSEMLAIKDGYLRTDECVPRMGYHYVNPARFTSTDPRKPGALIYAPHRNGKSRKLIAVEYFVIDEDQDVKTHNKVIPSMFGKRYDGPMPGHVPGMPVHYDLHAYVWTDNPDGVLATWNPNVGCPPH